MSSSNGSHDCAVFPLRNLSTPHFKLENVMNHDNLDPIYTRMVAGAPHCGRRLSHLGPCLSSAFGTRLLGREMR